MTKKAQVTQDLLDFIRHERLLPGQNLLPERMLAERFNASRNTVREAIKILEHRGIVEVRAGSGCYLKTLPDAKRYTEALPQQRVVSDLASQIEACHKIIPDLAASAVPEISDSDIQKLENTIVEISKAVINNDLPGLLKNDDKFRAIMIAALGNPVFDAMNALVKFDFNGMDQLFEPFPEAVVHHLFGGYVRTLDAIRNRNPEETRRLLEYNFLYLASRLDRQPTMVFSDRMKTLLSDFEPDPDLD